MGITRAVPDLRVYRVRSEVHQWGRVSAAVGDAAVGDAELSKGSLTDAKRPLAPRHAVSMGPSHPILQYLPDWQWTDRSWGGITVEAPTEPLVLMQ